MDMISLIGQSLGRYHILEQLGEGGMATVYKAYDTKMNRDVAIKVIRKDTFAPKDIERVLLRFGREAQALASLTHPNIVPVLDYGEYEKAPYLVMPYLPGGTLKQRLVKPLPYLEALQLIIPVAQALAHAHQQNIIHRDVKPANILITKTGEPMLSDFGIAKLLENEDTRELTATGFAVGTPEYMAPEQGLGKVDERSDIYALGVVLYQMITGHLPFRADTPMAIMLKKSQEPLPHPRQFVKNITRSMENALIKSLARDPQNRYQTMGEFIKALINISQGKGDESKFPILLWGGIGVASIILITIFSIVGLQLPGKLSMITREPDLITPAIMSEITAVQTNSPSQPDPPSTLTSPSIVPELELQTQINPADQAEMILIPAATFEMGLNETQIEALRISCNNCKELIIASQPLHTVSLDQYWIYKTEVSNGMYQKCVNAGGCRKPVRYSSNTRASYYNNPDYDNYPVIWVTWYHAEEYCKWAGGHLPTEAQWEYSARGPDGNLYSWGERLPDETLANVANLLEDTTPVDAYVEGASPFGLLDMTGNVWEWVFDWYQAGYYQSNSNWDNPIGPDSGEVREGSPLKSGRGGSFFISLGNSGGGMRDWYQVDWAGYGVGFRCALP